MTMKNIGDILVESGKLSPDQVESISSAQKEKGTLFGDTGKMLGYLSSDDINAALARQYNYAVAVPSDKNELKKNLVSLFAPFSCVTESIRCLRSELLSSCMASDSLSKCLSIVSPDKGDGRSFIAANLAISFAQLGENTLLIDADLRAPSQHLLFDLDNTVGLSTVLSGRASNNFVQPVKQVPCLSVIAGGPIPPNPQELLSNIRFVDLLTRCKTNYDAVIVDTSASSESADAYIVSLRTGNALAVARSGHSSTASFTGLLKQFQDKNISMVGSILNDR